jgi:DNA-binding transcriptional LysR family regulator
MFWKKLNRLTSISKFKSLSDAARWGKISQSTLSRNINDLEQFFGFRLISRDYKGIKLTEKGETY